MSTPSPASPEATSSQPAPHHRRHHHRQRPGVLRFHRLRFSRAGDRQAVLPDLRLLRPAAAHGGEFRRRFHHAAAGRHRDRCVRRPRGPQEGHDAHHFPDGAGLRADRLHAHLCGHRRGRARRHRAGAADPGLLGRRRGGRIDHPAGRARHAGQPRLHGQLAVREPGPGRDARRAGGGRPELFAHAGGHAELGLARAVRAGHADRARRHVHPPPPRGVPAHLAGGRRRAARKQPEDRLHAARQDRAGGHSLAGRRHHGRLCGDLLHADLCGARARASRPR
jgi:hypothetical protein